MLDLAFPPMMSFTIAVDASEVPEGFFQSEDCPLCGALSGEFCMYNDDRVAHTRHGVRDAACIEAAKRRALTPAFVGEPATGPRRRR